MIIAASVSSIDDAISACCSHPESVLLLGEILSEHDLAGAAAIINRLPPETRALMVCGDAERLTELIEVGFWGCLQQTVSAREVLRAVEAVAAGEYWAPRRVMTQIIRERLGNSGCISLGEMNDHGSLTRRESEILELVAQGYNNEQIAAALFIGRSTVKTHLLRTFRKLEAVDRTSAVTIALGRNLIRTSNEATKSNGG